VLGVEGRQAPKVPDQEEAVEEEEVSRRDLGEEEVAEDTEVEVSPEVG
jgi:hypothetical protein